MLSKQTEERIYRMLPLLPGLGGLALFGYGLWDGHAWMVVVGIFVALISFLTPRLKGRIEIALGALKFKGELTVEPDEDPDDPEQKP